MKIFRYLIFISILCGIFFVIYQKCDEKGFRRWRTSFKTAIIFSAIAAGLITVNTKAIEPTGNNNQVYQERLLSDQEFNSFEDNHYKVILVKTGDSSPSVPISPGRGQPNPFPTPPAGGRPSRPVYVPKYRTAPKVVPGLIQLAQVGAVEVLNLMIIVLFQKTKNHKNQKFLSMIILQMLQRKSNQLNSVSWKKMSLMEKSKLFLK